MLVVKCFLLIGVFSTSTIIGCKISKKYVDRADNLKKIKKGLYIFETKIEYTYDLLPDIFLEISKKIKGECGKIFYEVSKNMEVEFAGEAWDKAIDNSNLFFTIEDKEALKSLGKLLGTTDVDGQVRQIKLVNNFIDMQIKEAELQKNKNEKLYKKLGIIVGFAVVIVLA